MNDKITIFVSCHKYFPIPRNSLLAPIQVGAALTETRFPSFLTDDIGDNISNKNRSYCELTAQYWAWKNYEANYYGFFHYRRFLYPRPDEKRPYRIEGVPTKNLLNRLGYGDFPQLICKYDMILPKGEDMHVPVRTHYGDAPYHHQRDLVLTEEIVREAYPMCADALERYLSGTEHFFGNIFIMRREVFQDYCVWLFPILAEFDRRADVSTYGSQERRVDGYLAERLLGIYSTWRRNELKTLELPRVHFVPDQRERLQLKTQYFMLPPGSRQRAWMKAIMQVSQKRGTTQ